MKQRIKDDVFVYAEGGGSGADSAALQAEFRQAFADFFSKTVLGKTRRPRVVSCGGREQAFDAFKTARAQGKNALLLVDSEDPVSAAHQPPPPGNWQPWAHLKQQANWNQTPGSSDDDCHMMVQCMESWFLADAAALSEFFGNGFNNAVLPANQNIEQLLKPDVYQALEQATKSCKTKVGYSKGAHSFKLLSKIDPEKVMAASPWAKRFIDELAKRKS